MDYRVLPGAVLAMRLKKVETQRFRGDVEALAHFFEACIGRKPETKALEAVVANGERDAGF